jgi:UDPglucose 6-dehydrogenase
MSAEALVDPVAGIGSSGWIESDVHPKPREVVVVGCGHVGLVVAAGLAELGHMVTGIDQSRELVDRLCTGQVLIREDGLPELVQAGLARGNLLFTTSYDVPIARADFIFLAVPTPSTMSGAADLRALRGAVASILESLNGTSPILVNKSTVPIGTGETVEEIFVRELPPDHLMPRIVSNPEFLRQGRAVEDFFNPDRIVVGARNEVDAQAVSDLYEGLGGERVLTDIRTAELTKYVANAYLATRLSFINEISRLCEHAGVSVDDVIKGVTPDPRIGSSYFEPGVGFGGSCLPKDVAALRYAGESLGVATPLLNAVQEVNDAQKTSAVRKLRARLGTLEGRRIGVWGLTFKRDTEDTRDSPAADIVAMLLNEGARVRAYDPGVALEEGFLSPHLRAIVADSALDAATGADALVVLTNWPQFAHVDLDSLRDVMHGNVILDGRNLLSQARLEAAGFVYYGVGRTPRNHKRRRTDS